MLTDPEIFWNALDTDATRGYMVLLEQNTGPDMQQAICQKFINDIPKLFQMILTTPTLGRLNYIFQTSLREILKHEESAIKFKKLVWRELIKGIQYDPIKYMNLNIIEYVCKTGDLDVSLFGNPMIFLRFDLTYEKEYRKLCLVIKHNWLQMAELNRPFAEMLLTKI